MSEVIGSDSRARRRWSLRNLWASRKGRGLIYQVLMFTALLLLILLLVGNAFYNMEQRGLKAGFGFLNRTAGFGIVQSLVSYDETSTYGRAFVVALLNTILVAGIGVVLATMLGFMIGIMRLSPNWLIARIAAIYVETFRNIPLLLQILFWYVAILKPLPAPLDLFQQGESFSLSFNNRGLVFATPLPQAGFSLVLWVLLLAIIGSIAWGWYARRRQLRKGDQLPVLWPCLAGIVGLPVAVFLLLGAPLDFALPVMSRFTYEGGSTVVIEFFALLWALVIYTAAFIADIVRAGIQGIPYGQSEAAYSLGLKRGQALKLVTIPQALRIIIPPLTSQYLNLTKNSSLAAAIAYPDLVSVFAGTALNQTGRAIEIMFMTLSVYLSLSLLTSFAMNTYQRRTQLVER